MDNISLTTPSVTVDQKPAAYYDINDSTVIIDMMLFDGQGQNDIFSIVSAKKCKINKNQWEERDITIRLKQIATLCELKSNLTSLS